MQIEYEATFVKVDKEKTRERLLSAGAKLQKSEFLQKRAVFNLPATSQVVNGWARVRDESDKITVSVKSVEGDAIHDQKEVCVQVDSFENAELLLESLGCVRKAYQETLRELWLLDGVEITIDTWPFLDSFVEVEGVSEGAVRTVSEKLGFQWSDAKFCAVDQLYEDQYGVSKDIINNETPLITFGMENPFK
jgi:adenylate cyclase class 2